jgi:hypothetical protein
MIDGNRLSAAAATPFGRLVLTTADGRSPRRRGAGARLSDQPRPATASPWSTPTATKLAWIARLERPARTTCGGWSPKRTRTAVNSCPRSSRLISVSSFATPSTWRGGYRSRRDPSSCCGARNSSAASTQIRLADRGQPRHPLPGARPQRARQAQPQAARPLPLNLTTAMAAFSARPGRSSGQPNGRCRVIATTNALVPRRKHLATPRTLPRPFSRSGEKGDS